MSAHVMEIRDRLAAVHENIENALERSGRGEEQVRILVATKYYHPEQLFALAEAGVDLIGENRAEDLLDKQELFGDRFEWHFIGHLQRRKAKVVVPRVTLVHSVDSVRLIEELAKRAPQGRVDILIQVNVAHEESKFGVSEEEIGSLHVFAKLRTIRDNLRKSWSPHFDLSELSMGMSGDYEVAVEEGATVVRIGRMLIEEDGPVRRHDGS
jgi:PLP dependent protein